MLNYIWAGLVILSFGFAMVTDGLELLSDKYRNGQALAVTLRLPNGYAESQPSAECAVEIRADVYAGFYGTTIRPAESYPATLLQRGGVRELRFAKGANLPEPLATIRDFVSPSDKELRGRVDMLVVREGQADAAVVFPMVRFVKLKAITQAAVDFAGTAVTLAIGLVGVLALWMGMVQIAEKAGLIHLVVKLVQPFLRLLFPQIPKDHPALGMIALNLSANMLGLGNAATPLGLKAMEELQKLNPTDDTATDPMVMLLALNTAGVQIVPPAMLVAIMGVQANQLFFPILLVTFCCAVIAFIATRTLGMLPWYRRSNPESRIPSPETRS